MLAPLHEEEVPLATVSTPLHEEEAPLTIVSAPLATVIVSPFQFILFYFICFADFYPFFCRFFGDLIYH